MSSGRVKAAEHTGQVKAARVHQGVKCQEAAECAKCQGRGPSVKWMCQEDVSRLQECAKVSSVKRLPSAPSVKAGGQVSSGHVRRTCQGCKSTPSVKAGVKCQGEEEKTTKKKKEKKRKL